MRLRLVVILSFIAAVAAGLLPAAASAVVVAPQPEHVPSVRASALISVSCVSDMNCVAVGWQPIRGSGLHGLVESWNGTRWTRPRAANGQDVLAGPNQLQGVSCTGPQSCVVVGSTVRGLLNGKPIKDSPARVPVALREVGGDWRLSLTVQHRGALTLAARGAAGITPYGVACRPSFCMIVGDTTAGRTGLRAGAARWLFTPPDAD